MAEIVDQSQLQNGNGAGFGEFLHNRYRGMGFTPGIASLTAIEFQRGKGGQGIKIYVDTADANSIPTHAVGSELYSWTVPNASITGSFQKFTLPVEQILTIGAQYAFYIAPWNTTLDTYFDDYQDMQWKNSDVYAGGKPIIWNVDSVSAWAVSDGGNLDAYFQTYGNEAAATTSRLALLGVGV